MPKSLWTYHIFCAIIHCEMMSVGFEKPPFHIQLHLTDKCNLKCRHCYEGERKASNEWNYDELLRLIADFEFA